MHLAKNGDRIGRIDLYQHGAYSGLFAVNGVWYKNLFTRDKYSFDPKDFAQPGQKIENISLLNGGGGSIVNVTDTFIYDPTSPKVAAYVSWGTAAIYHMKLLDETSERLIPLPDTLGSITADWQNTNWGVYAIWGSGPDNTARDGWGFAIENSVELLPPAQNAEGTWETFALFNGPQPQVEESLGFMARVQFGKPPTINAVVAAVIPALEQDGLDRAGTASEPHQGPIPGAST